MDYILPVAICSVDCGVLSWSPGAEKDRRFRGRKRRPSRRSRRRCCPRRSAGARGPSPPAIATGRGAASAPIS